MILNPSHKITLSGLPPDILDAYVRYKKGTRAIVSWIVQYGPSNYQGARSLPLKELARLASSLAGKLKELPEVIHFHFRETIAARKRLSKYFRGNLDESVEDVNTINHEHFTMSLTEIYEGLCACCSKPKRDCDTQRTETRSLSSVHHIGNPFECLSGVEGQTISQFDNDLDSNARFECHEQAPTTCPGPHKEIALADDDLGNRIQVAIILQRVSEIVNEIRVLWRPKASSNLHFIKLAVATNVALADLMRMESEMRDVDEENNVEMLARACYTLVKKDRADLNSREAGPHDLIQRLQANEAAFKRYIEGDQPIRVVSCSACMQRPANYVQYKPGHSTAELPLLERSLVDNMMHLIADEKVISSIVKSSSPVCNEIRQVLARKDEKPKTTRLNLGLLVLSESYQTYHPSTLAAEPSTIFRLTALKLSQQARKSIANIIDDKTCFPCQCPQTLAYHLHHLEADLDAYARQRCWNSYFQSPWVAGNHILEMLDLCHYYGQKLFAYRHYVGSILHSYNVLQQLAGLEAIPCLEGLCNQFESTFFPGGRPKSSFRACWTRYIGARIKFKKGHRNRNERDSWCMAIPPHAARRASGLGVGLEERDGKDGSLLFKIKQQDYNVTEKQWASMSAAQDPKARLENLSRAIEKEMSPRDESPFPAALINHFAVFASCVKVISSLSDASHTDPKEQGINCICFASAILNGADRIVNARRLGKVAGAAWTKAEREGVLDLTMKALRDEMNRSEKAFEEWLWMT